MWVAVILTLVLVGLLHWLIFGTFGFWKKRNVPYPKPTALFGNTGASLTFSKHLGQIYQDIYNSFKDYSWVGIYQFRTPAILVRNVDLLKDIFIKDFASFHDNDIDLDEDKDPLFGKNPFVLKGKRWKVVRGQVTSAITTGKIKNMFTFINNVSKDMVNYLNTAVDNKANKAVDAKDLSARYTTDVVASCAFGLEGKSFTDAEPEFKKMGENLFQPQGFQKIKLLLVFIFPKLSNYLAISIFPDSVIEWFTSILKQAIKYREDNKIVRNDYLDMMLALKHKPGEYVFTDIDVMAQSMTFYSDGMETSAAALSFVLLELAKNPDVQEKLRKEASAVLKKYNGEISYDCVQELPYLEMIILETLRLYPPIPFLSKRCTLQYTLPSPSGHGSGVEIEPKMSVIIPILAIHMDPEIYPEPESFIPERFSEEEKKNRPKCAFLSFGEGPRQCLGFRFGLAQIKGAVMAIVTNFEIKLNEKTPPAFEIDPSIFLTAKKGGIYLDFEKIST